MEKQKNAKFGTSKKERFAYCLFFLGQSQTGMVCGMRGLCSRVCRNDGSYDVFGKRTS